MLRLSFHFNMFLGLIFILAISVCKPALAVPVQTTATAIVNLTNGLVLEELRQLSFGNVLIPSSAQSPNVVIVARNGSYTQGSTLGDAQQSGRFQITGNPGDTVDITSSLSAPQGNGITLVALDHRADRQLDATTGIGNFNVGGTLSVTDNALTGNYTLTYTVTVEYQ